MAKPISVIDDHANVNETVQSMGRILGRDKVRRSVFNAVYGRHSKPSAIDRIMAIAKLGSHQKQQVRNALSKLSAHNIIVTLPSTAGARHKRYEKSSWVNARKREILKAADDSKWRESLPTKRNPKAVLSGPALRTKIVYEGVEISVRELTIDDLDSFSKVKGVNPSAKTLKGLSEEQFKKGIQSIIGEKGVFKDWGGEQSDLMTTRLLYKGKRIPTAFAFKGPGLSSILTLTCSPELSSL